MSVIYILVLISITVAICFLAAFFWAVKDGQFDDAYSPAVRMLLDDKPIKENQNNSKQISKQ